MGYYSSMEPLEFKTDYSAEEVKAKFQAFKDNRPNNSPWLDIYDFDEIRDCQELSVVMVGDDYYAKHYASEDLALFISTIIKPGHYAVLTFLGEDGETWGHLIRAMQVDELRMQWTLSGDIFIDDFLEKERLNQ
jgi:hypothetical protein